MKKLRHREVKEFAEDHTASKLNQSESVARHSAFKAHALTAIS